MTCQDYEQAILDLARGDGTLRPDEAVTQHLQRCHTCERFYERQRRITAGLRALSAADAGAAPSRALEAQLRAAFAAQRRPSATEPLARRQPPRAWLPVAAALALATAALVWQAGVRSREPRILSPGGFVPLPTAATLPALERGEIVRVQVSLAELPAYGIAVPPVAGRLALEADVLVGQDGLPRAIRLVTDEVQ